jgi:hypothetical protein
VVLERNVEAGKSAQKFPDSRFPLVVAEETQALGSLSASKFFPCAPSSSSPWIDPAISLSQRRRTDELWKRNSQTVNNSASQPFVNRVRGQGTDHMNAKRKGTAREHRSLALLESLGYRCTRAAASLGAWDIIGVGSTDVVLCQVKSRDWPGAAELETLQGFPCPPCCRKLLHRWLDRKRLPDVREL